MKKIRFKINAPIDDRGDRYVESEKSEVHLHYALETFLHHLYHCGNHKKVVLEAIIE